MTNHRWIWILRELNEIYLLYQSYRHCFKVCGTVHAAVNQEEILLRVQRPFPFHHMYVYDEMENSLF